MTPEEKAKAYDEVVARINKAVSDGLVSENFGRDMLGIAESEDEGIRKGLSKFLWDVANGEVKSMPSASQCQEWLAYLEKQKEQKPISGNSEKPNTQWSEEDEDNLKRAINICVSDFGEGSETAKFLKSLPERFNLQPKEWSKEDEEHLDSIIESYRSLLKDYKACHDVDYIPYNSDTVCRNVVDDIVFLKSLRPSWKPSEEQMDWRATAVRLSADKPAIHKVIASLYNDLEKLM